MKKNSILFLFLIATHWIFAQAPANDDPCGAILLTVNNYCVSVNGTTVNSTNSTNAQIQNPSCAGYAGYDVWYKFVVPATGNFQVKTIAGSITDGAMALYSAASCNTAMTQIGCNDDFGQGNNNMPSISLTGRTPGEVIYARVWKTPGNGNGNANNSTGTFGICVIQNTSCGTNNNNDYCPSPATLFQGPGSFSAATEGTFTPDQPGNLTSVFCGTIQNNSWYKFTASSTSHDFPIISVTGCTAGNGIQAQVYQITSNASGCCDVFVSKSNCFNPGIVTLGTVTATNLTIGQDYMLMVDGYAGDACQFTIDGWTAINVLPVELTGFSGENTSEGNWLSWATETEKNSDRFEIYFSSNGHDFEQIGSVDAQGNSDVRRYYSFLHQGPMPGVNYYKIRQIDLDGTQRDSELIAIHVDASTGLFNLSPNPANDKVELVFNANSKDAVSWRIYAMDGQVVEINSETINEGLTKHVVDVSKWKPGVYSLVVSTKEGNTIKKLIIQ